MWVASFSSQLWFEMKGSGKNPFCNCVFDFLSITQKIVAAKPHSTSNMKMQICTQVKTLPAKKTNFSLLLVNSSCQKVQI